MRLREGWAKRLGLGMQCNLDCNLFLQFMAMCIAIFIAVTFIRMGRGWAYLQRTRRVRFSPNPCANRCIPAGLARPKTEGRGAPLGATRSPPFPPALPTLPLAVPPLTPIRKGRGCGRSASPAPGRRTGLRPPPLPPAAAMVWAPQAGRPGKQRTTTPGGPRAGRAPAGSVNGAARHGGKGSRGAPSAGGCAKRSRGRLVSHALGGGA